MEAGRVSVLLGRGEVRGVIRLEQSYGATAGARDGGESSGGVEVGRKHWCGASGMGLIHGPPAGITSLSRKA